MDEVFSLMGSLNNLALIKIAHDQGIPVDIFDDYFIDWYYRNDNTWDNFIAALQYLFDIVEYFPPYNDICLEEKEYWIEQVAGAEGVYNDTMVLVCLDDNIQPFQPFDIGDDSLFLATFAEVYPIDRGFILFYHQEDVGEIDVVEAFVEILERILNREVIRR